MIDCAEDHTRNQKSGPGDTKCDVKDSHAIPVWGRGWHVIGREAGHARGHVEEMQLKRLNVRTDNVGLEIGEITIVSERFAQFPAQSIPAEIAFKKLPCHYCTAKIFFPDRSGLRSVHERQDDRRAGNFPGMSEEGEDQHDPCEVAGMSQSPTRSSLSLECRNCCT